MDSEPKFIYWLELPEAQLVKFGDLPGLVAGALHSDSFAQAGAEINLEAELVAMVDAGTLRVLDPLTLGPHTFPIGDALRRAVLMPWDIRPLLLSKGIGLRLTPYGTGPDLWTIENAAAAIGDQEGLHKGARSTLIDQMVKAAEVGTLTVRHPHTDLPFRPDAPRAYYELVTPADVNAWLAQDPVSTLRWRDDKGAKEPPSLNPPPSVVPKQSKARVDDSLSLGGGGWKSDAVKRGWEIVKEATQSSLAPSQLIIAERIAREWKEANRFGPNGSALSGEYIKRHALVPSGVSCKRARLKASTSAKSGQGK